MGSLGAECDWALSDDRESLSKPEWDAQRPGMICTDADTFANWLSALMKLCDSYSNCTYVEREIIEKAGLRILNLSN